MLPAPKFVGLHKSFWAHVKFVSESLGYSQRRAGTLRRYKLDEFVSVFSETGLSTEHLLSGSGQPTDSGSLLLEYLNYRTEVLEQNKRSRVPCRGGCEKGDTPIFVWDLDRMAAVLVGDAGNVGAVKNRNVPFFGRSSGKPRGVNAYSR